MRYTPASQRRAETWIVNRRPLTLIPKAWYGEHSCAKTSWKAPQSCEKLKHLSALSMNGIWRPPLPTRTEWHGGGATAVRRLCDGRALQREFQSTVRRLTNKDCSKVVLPRHGATAERTLGLHKVGGLHCLNTSRLRRLLDLFLLESWKTCLVSTRP